MGLKEIFQPKQSQELTPIIRIEPAIRKSYGAATSPSLGFSLGYTAPETGVSVNHLTALSSAPVWNALKAISEDIAKLPIKMYRKLPHEASQQIEDHPITRLLRKPNQRMNSFDFIRRLVFDHQLYGNAYVYIIRDETGMPTELLPIMPYSSAVMISTNGKLVYTMNSQFIPNGSNASGVPAEDVIHLRNGSLDEGIYGISPMGIGQQVLGLALATQKHAAKTFAQGTQLSGVLSHPGIVSDEAASRMAESWQHAYSGSENAHKVAFLEEGTAFQSISQTAMDSQLLESRRFTVEEVARLFNIPQYRIGGHENSTYSNIESESQAYIAQTLGSIVRQLECAFEDKLLFETEQKDYFLKFDFDEMLRTDTKTRFDSHAVGIQNGFLTRNEARAAENLNPIPGGDEMISMLNMGTKPTESGAPKLPPSGEPTS